MHSATLKLQKFIKQQYSSEGTSEVQEKQKT